MENSDSSSDCDPDPEVVAMIEQAVSGQREPSSFRSGSRQHPAYCVAKSNALKGQAAKVWNRPTCLKAHASPLTSGTRFRKQLAIRKLNSKIQQLLALHEAKRQKFLAVQCEELKNFKAKQEQDLANFELQCNQFVQLLDAENQERCTPCDVSTNRQEHSGVHKDCTTLYESCQRHHDNKNKQNAHMYCMLLGKLLGHLRTEYRRTIFSCMDWMDVID